MPTVSLFGESPRCRWASSSQIDVSLGPGATLVPRALSLSINNPSIGQISFASGFELASSQASSSSEGEQALMFHPFDSYSVGFPDVLEPPRASLLVPQSGTWNIRSK